MDRTWLQVLVFILAVLFGLTLGAFLMYGYMSRSGNITQREPRTQVTVCVPGSDEAWAAEPFLVLPAEHGFYLRDYAGKDNRDDTDL